MGAAGALVLGAGRTRSAGAAFQADGLATVDFGGVAVIPRATWGGDLAPTRPIPGEPDVRYLLVHHSVDPGNDYGEAAVVGVLRGFVRFHTAQKGWPDLAYNFLVDRFGRVWEGRTGSLAGPVAGDATGGNQGFDQLCCFIGNHQEGEPSRQAFQSMGNLLGALARRYAIPVGPSATVAFTSRGSNRYPAGTEVTTSTVAGHRDMSRTQCPGDLVAARLPELRLLAAAAGSGSGASGSSSAGARPTSPPPASQAVTGPPAGPAAPRPAPAPAPAASPGSVPVPAPGALAAPATTSGSPATPAGASAIRRRADGRAIRLARQSEDGDGVGATGAVAAGAAAAAAGAVWARWRRDGPHQSDARGAEQAPEQSS